jgi:hypothetical protein
MVFAPNSSPPSAPPAGRTHAIRTSEDAPGPVPAPAGGAAEHDPTATHWLSQALAVWLGTTSSTKPSNSAGDH